MTMANAVALMKTLRFGIEVETVGVGQEQMARALGSTFGWVVDGRRLHMPDGRVWECQHDGSLPGAHTEIVSPILRYEDLDLLQNVVRAARAAGAKATEKCGIHVHVGSSGLDYAGVIRLARIVHAHEAVLFHALGVRAERRDRFCQPVPARFMTEALRMRGNATREQMMAAWYGSSYATPSRYDRTRYHGLNLNSHFFRGTVEFRYFEGTTHAGKIKAYVQLCLALLAYATTATRVSPTIKAFDPVTVKYRMRDLVTRLGLNGDEFKTARLHLFEHLPGTSSNPARARARANEGSGEGGSQ